MRFDLCFECLYWCVILCFSKSLLLGVFCVLGYDKKKTRNKILKVFVNHFM